MLYCVFHWFSLYVSINNNSAECDNRTCSYDGNDPSVSNSSSYKSRGLCSLDLVVGMKELFRKVPFLIQALYTGETCSIAGQGSGFLASGRCKRDLSFPDTYYKAFLYENGSASYKTWFNDGSCGSDDSTWETKLISRDAMRATHGIS
ncbi:hypothetical protein PR003_g4630 [Phytophthora rubi]|uniref:Uncharacterized protein n=1 Tax=Phytophthora rubi TaxID=129364 RepID=A0A6A4FSF4_9STRA|nr:hypothetical protein PR002_g20720 [Phytophthora rubi]KAE9004902.1 hypothetical protein PR001_g17592 [Phytophthora rubi]KAE9351977.1 hypothetical protein PR003_g4630 [Phytophthora rubi]